MNPQAKEQWLKDLRSGEFRQTTKALQNGNGYCCLGLLCRICPDVKSKQEGWLVRFIGRHEESSITGLPLTVQNWAGLYSPSAYVEELLDREYRSQSLAELNDSGLTFSQIADIVEHFL